MKKYVDLEGNDVLTMEVPQEYKSMRLLAGTKLMSNEEYMEASVIVECRKTWMGAFTSVTEHDPRVTVEEFDTSGTGRHWKERVTGPVGAQYFLTDITNSGKDRSAWCTLVSE